MLIFVKIIFICHCYEILSYLNQKIGTRFLYEPHEEIHPVGKNPVGKHENPDGDISDEKNIATLIREFGDYVRSLSSIIF